MAAPAGVKAAHSVSRSRSNSSHFQRKTPLLGRAARCAALAQLHKNHNYIMALIICPECGHQISDQAPLCPHCGCPMTPAGTNSYGQQSAQPQSAAPAQAPIYRRQPGTDDYVPVTSRRRHTGRNILLAILCTLAVMVAMLFLTCPGAEDHRREMRQLSLATTKVLADEQDNIFASSMCTLFSDKLIAEYLVNQLEVHNYGVVSIGRLDNPLSPGHSAIVSVGVLGKVFTASPETVAVHLKTAIRSAKKKLVEDVTENIEERINSAVDDITEKVKEGVSDVTSGLIEDLTSEIQQELSGDKSEDEEQE